MIRAEEIDRAVEACYQASAAPEGWTSALRGLARSLDAVCCSVAREGVGEARLRLPASPEYRDFLTEFVGDGWWRTDHRAARGWPLLRGGGKVLLEHDIATEEERRTLPQYHELYARYDLPWWAVVSFKTDGELWAMPFLRSSKQGPFQRKEAAHLRGLAPHLARILRLATLFAATSARSALDIIGRIGTAAMLVDNVGRIAAINPQAESLLGPDLKLIRGRLVAVDRASDNALQVLLSDMLVCSKAAPAIEGPVRISRMSGRPLLVDALPVSGLIDDPALDLRSILLLTDPDRGRAPAAERLRAALALTPAEARVAAQIASGRSPRETAASLGLSEETARTTLKRVFAKVGVSRQSELAALVARLTIG